MRKTKTIKIQSFPYIPLYSLFGGYIDPEGDFESAWLRRVLAATTARLPSVRRRERGTVPPWDSLTTDSNRHFLLLRGTNRHRFFFDRGT